MNEPVHLQLPARRFAAAWHNVSLAASDDPERHALYRAVEIDCHPGFGGADATRLTATDGHVLFTAALTHHTPDDDAAPYPLPTIEDAPSTSLVVRDPDRRCHALMAWILKATKDEDELHVSRRRTLVLRTETAEDQAAPTLDPSLDRLHLVIDAGDEALALPIVETEKFPNWRSLIHAHVPGVVGRSSLSAEIVGRVAKFKDSLQTCDFTFGHKATAGVLMQVTGDPIVEGLVMPVHTKHVEREQDGQASSVSILRSGSGVMVGGAA